MTRVAALQFASGTDVDKNLATCLRMIDQGASEGAEIMVLPEFCNHISWYDDAAHAWQVSVDLDGGFLQAVAARAAAHSCHVIINVSLRHDDAKLTISSIMYGPAGERLGIADKQTLMGHENTWFTRASVTSPVVNTSHGKLAMFPCRDGVTCETPRGLALRGAQLFCDSLNSFALDEASLHVPARAPENKVFLVAANKVGALIPEPLLQAVSEQTHIPLRFLNGAGGSQVVSPTGEILALGPTEGEAVVIADIDLALADNKLRPDGSHIFSIRRPELYQPIADQPHGPYCQPNAAERVSVACMAPSVRGRAALQELDVLVGQVSAQTRLAVLPELFSSPSNAVDSPAAALALAEETILVMQQACRDRPDLLLCSALVQPQGAGYTLAAVLVGSEGIVASQPLLHRSERLSWAETGDELSVVDLPWGRIALLAGDDASVPEIVKLAALKGIHTLVLPMALQAQWEQRYGLPSRAAENRICVVASSYPINGVAGLIADLEPEFTLMTEWHQRQFDGFINDPLVTEQAAGQGILEATICPRAAANKLMSEQTDLLQHRPWFLSQDLVSEGFSYD